MHIRFWSFVHHEITCSGARQCALSLYGARIVMRRIPGNPYERRIFTWLLLLRGMLFLLSLLSLVKVLNMAPDTQIFTGHPPFHHILSEVDVILAVYNHEHPLPPLISDPATSCGLDDRMWAVMMRCWNANPEERPTANDLCHLRPKTPATSCSSITDVNMTMEERVHTSASGDMPGVAGDILMYSIKQYQIPSLLPRL